MRPLNGFTVSIFLLLVITPLSTRAQSESCRKLELTVDVTSSSGTQDGTIKVSAKDNSVKFVLYLFSKGKENRKNDQLSITSGKIENVPPGTYDLMIHYPDENICTETRKVTVN